ncbi:MAG: hypothetical protein IJN94_07220, partial [Clostridia bacterium]|nr:hypothetical protein [Clostridia bacterium]
MSQQFLKITVSTILMMCLLCSLSTVFAENGDIDFDFNIQPIEPTTQVETIPAETEKETEKETVKETPKQFTVESVEKNPVDNTKAETTIPQTGSTATG